MDALIETRNEYVEHMQDLLAIELSKRINKIWDDNNSNVKKFQSELTQIKKWNNNIINEEFKKIVAAAEDDDTMIGLMRAHIEQHK